MNYRELKDQWRIVEDALQAKRDWWESTLPIRQKNERINSHNKEVKALHPEAFEKSMTLMSKKRQLEANDIRRKLGYIQPLKYKPCPRSVLRILAAETAQKSLLKLRSGAEWLLKLNLIEDYDIRHEAACVVWWDYFSLHEGAFARHEIDHLVKPHPFRADNRDIALALYFLDYSAHASIDRSMQPKCNLK